MAVFYLRLFKEWLKHHSISEGAPSGAHINMSINDDLVELVYQQLPQRFENKVAAQNYLYQIIVQGFMRYRWFLTYLFGASPIAEANFFENSEQPLKRPVRSIRQSQKYGFENKFPGDYSSVENYAKKVMNAVKAGKLQSAAEFHGQVRFKGNSDLNKMVKEGVDYIELRMLDLDPTSSVGIRTGTLRFIRLLAGYFIMSPSLKESEAGRVIARADEMNEHVALEDPTTPCEYAPTAKALIRHLQLFVNQIQAGPEYQEILDDLEYRVNHPETTPSGQLVEKIKNNSLVDYALHQARKYQDGAIQALRPFRGFEENNGNISADELAKELFEGTWRLNKS